MSDQLDTLEPSDDDVSQDQFRWATNNPHAIDAPDDPGETLRHSIQCAWHLDAAKSAFYNDDPVAAYKAVNKVMQHFLPLHAAAARASELNPNRIREEQQED